MLKLSSCLSLAALCAVAVADFPLAAWDDDGSHRVWYGDGNLFIGSTIPAEVEIAFNFTILEPRNTNFDFWFLTPSVGDEDLESSLHLGQRPFLAIHPNEKSSPMFFTEDVAKFLATSENVAYTWLHYQSLAIPVEQSGEPIAGSTYLRETSAPGTFMVIWDTERTEDMAGMQMVNLLTTMETDEDEG